MDTWHIFKLDKFDPVWQIQGIHRSFYIAYKEIGYSFITFFLKIYLMYLWEVVFALVEMLSWLLS